MRVVIGGRGKMGQLLAAEAERAGFEVMGMFVAFNLDSLKAMEPADMIIDFSHRDNLAWILDYVNEHNCSLVYGTTGLNEEQKASLQKLSEDHPVFFSANYSYGVAVLQEIIRTAAPLLKDSFDIELTETHHNQKQDAPSGTAKALLEILNPDKEVIYSSIVGRGERRYIVNVSEPIVPGENYYIRRTYYDGNNKEVSSLTIQVEAYIGF